jgi:hypothetical protein
VDVLNPPPLSVTGRRSLRLNWRPATDQYGTGYRVRRATAQRGTYAGVATVIPRTTTTYVDAPALGKYYYVVTAYVRNWRSEPTNEVSCTAVALAYVC